MADTNKNKEHWETVYETKTPSEVSWTQEIPETSLNFIASLELTKEAHIIDVGGGDSKLVDHLLKLGYKNITVLDISAKAIERAQKRLGEQAQKVTWIISDITNFQPERAYDVWHDRATFHFLTTQEETSKYLDIVQQTVNGFLIIGTFSENGPTKCSGLEIKQYSEQTLTEKFENKFEKISCITVNHTTPNDKIQNFTFCSFKNKNTTLLSSI
ncbi:class I SAM-dependent methyltransferase [Flavobacterium sharifuzzamanii]|uniref:class I SAM-dependent methyltransferase n=1 Tax=Flavobacterium sharifuzzamanii TaxID=2211133 RepID=UPI000DAD29D3|nr:class I SAM-dependent methyltransferase [Flavobacterium sharifuzzamanii]KAF2082345.1 class I SAM-dependent methyltransferase [Flavobacterium sharifuzzamanii]